MRTPAGLARVAVPLLAAALLGAATLAPTPAVAAAKAPLPKVRTFGAVADDFPRWERENTCSPTEKPGAAALRKLLRKTYGKSIASSTVRPCSRADSGHEEGRAVDWMTNRRVPEQKALAVAFLAWLQAPDVNGNADAMARRLGVEYVIWNNRMWRAYDPARGWTQYDGCLGKKKKYRVFDSTCHRTHVHISLSWDGAYQRTSFSSGFVACPSSTQSWPAVPTEGPVGSTGFVAVPPARILSTRDGTGTPNGPCRLRGGARFDLPQRAADLRCGGRDAARRAPAGRLAHESARMADGGRDAYRPGCCGEPRSSFRTHHGAGGRERHDQPAAQRWHEPAHC